LSGFFSTGDTDGSGVGDLGGLRVGDGVGVGGSLGSGVGFFFLAGVGDGDSSSAAFLPAAGDFLFLGDGDSSAAGVGEVFFLFGDALGEGDGFVADFLCRRGVGVGVGVEKIFLIDCPRDCAGSGEGSAMIDPSARSAKTRVILSSARNDGITPQSLSAPLC